MPRLLVDFDAVPERAGSIGVRPAGAVVLHHAVPLQVLADEGDGGGALSLSPVVPVTATEDFSSNVRTTYVQDVSVALLLKTCKSNQIGTKVVNFSWGILCYTVCNSHVPQGHHSLGECHLLRHAVPHPVDCGHVVLGSPVLPPGQLRHGGAVARRDGRQHDFPALFGESSSCHKMSIKK